MNKFFYKYTVAACGTRPLVTRHFPMFEDCLQYAKASEGLRVIHRSQVEGGFESTVADLEGIDAGMITALKLRVQTGAKRSERCLDVHAAAPSFSPDSRGKMIGVITCLKFSDVDQLIAIKELPDVVSNAQA